MSILKKMGKQMTLRKRLLLLLVGLLLLIALVVSLTVRDRTGLSLFARWFTFDNEDNSATFSHGLRSEDLFTNLDNNLLACSDKSLQLFKPNGDMIFKESINLTNPAFASNGKQAAVYDVGGQILYVVAKNKIVHRLELPKNQYILSTTINQKGWLAVTTKEDGFKGVVTVYDNEYHAIVSIRRSSSHLTNAILTPDSKSIYILTPGQSAGIFESKLLYYSLSHVEEDPAQISLGNKVVLSMRASANRCWVLTDSELFMMHPSGEIADKYPYGNKYLKRADLGGNDFAALLLSNSPSGNTGTLVTVDAQGQEIKSLELNEQVLAMAAAGRYVAVLTPSRILLYTKDLSEVSVSDNLQGIQNLVLYPDGSLSLITDELARLYLP